MTHQISSDDWRFARRIVTAALASSLHCSIASVGPDGTPHVTPIGSLTLRREPGHGFYFDVFNARLAKNVVVNPRVSVLAVDSSTATWGTAMMSGTFAESPGARLTGSVGPRRPATPGEIANFQRRLGALLETPGGTALWSNVTHVRDIVFDSIARIRLGSTTHASARAL